MTTLPEASRAAPQRYTTAMHVLHLARAEVILGTLTAGIVMVNLPDELPFKFETLYPNHKRFFDKNSNADVLRRMV